MSEKISIDLGDVQKTLLLPLWGRAVETQKSKPLLVDLTATDITDKIDYDFSEATKDLTSISQLGWIARCIHIDELITSSIKTNPSLTVINIGCGLDTTFNRVTNGKLSWYDVDLPDVMALRKKLIPELENQTYITSSFLNNEWLNVLNPQEKVLFIAAGVFYYFEEKQLKAFFIHLADKFPEGEILFDASSPVGIRMANRMVIKVSGMDEKSFLKWGLKDAKILESWDTRIKIIDQYPMFEAIRNRLPLKDKVVAWISDRLKMQYMVHLKLLDHSLI